MSFNFSQSLSLGEEFSPDFADFDSEFDSEFDCELPGYNGDRARTATSRSRGRTRPVRGTLPPPYPGERTRNKYSIPGQNLAREDQLQQRVAGFKEKLESLEKMSSDQVPKRMEMLVKFSIQDLETVKSGKICHEKHLELIRGLHQKLDQSTQVASSQDIDQKYKELDELDRLATEYKAAINTKQADINQKITKAFGEFKFNSEIEL